VVWARSARHCSARTKVAGPTCNRTAHETGSCARRSLHPDARFEHSPFQNYHSAIDIGDETAILAVVPSCCLAARGSGKKVLARGRPFLIQLSASGRAFVAAGKSGAHRENKPLR
jgi:hypothetical protein